MQQSVMLVTPCKARLDALKPKWVAGYARVSSGKDSMIHSLSAQVSYFSSLIQSTPGWEYAGVYADEATTGTKETRGEFQRLLADCRAGKVDIVLTKSVSRFARNTLTTLETVRELRALGVDVYFEEQNIHSLSMEGEFLLTLLAVYAQEESRSVSDNLKWRIRDKYKRGEPGSITMYGYRMVDGMLRIVPAEAEVIRLAAHYYLQGMGGIRIAALLNASGIPTKHARKWREHTVREMLFNEKLAGDMLLQKTFVDDPITKRQCINRGELPQYLVKNSHEPILDRATRDAILAERARRAAHFRPPTTERAVYPFSSKVVCGQCGAHYRRKIVGAAAKYKKSVWICQTYNTHGKALCPSQQVPEDILQNAAARAMDLPVFDAETFERAVKEIRVPGKGALIFVFHDGSEIHQAWENPSRRESWDDAARQQARDHANKRYGKGGDNV